MTAPDELADETPRMVFVVTWGEYSAYRIISIWETRAEAEKHLAVESWNGYEARIEEWVLNQQEEGKVTQWRAELDSKTGEIVVDDKPFESAQIMDSYVDIDRADKTWHGHGWGYGLSPELARKALADALAKAKAEREGL